METNEITIDGRKLTEKQLRVVLAHYDAIPILIKSAKENKDFTALSYWDRARNKTKHISC